MEMLTVLISSVFKGRRGLFCNPQVLQNFLCEIVADFLALVEGDRVDSSVLPVPLVASLAPSQNLGPAVLQDFQCTSCICCIVWHYKDRYFSIDLQILMEKFQLFSATSSRWISMRLFSGKRMENWVRPWRIRRQRRPMTNSSDP